MTQAKAIRLTINDQEIRIRDTFDLALRLEERFGSLFDLILRPRKDVPLGDVFGIFEEVLRPEGIGPGEIRQHISAIGLSGAWNQIALILNVIAGGWAALGEEATASADENPLLLTLDRALQAAE